MLEVRCSRVAAGWRHLPSSVHLAIISPPTKPLRPHSRLVSPQEREASVQKRSYKVLAYLCEARPDFLEAHFQEV